MAGVMLVRDVMTKAIKTVRPDASVREVVQKMNKFNIGSIVVVDARKRPVGIITERDVLQKIVEQGLDPSTVRVKEIMSTPLVTVDSGVSVEEVATLMARKQIKKLPVLENNNLVGIVTSMDILRAAPKLVSLFEELLHAKFS